MADNQGHGSHPALIVVTVVAAAAVIYIIAAYIVPAVLSSFGRGLFI